MVEPYSVANKISDGRGLVLQNINAKHGPVIIFTGEITRAFNFVTKHAMHISVLKLLPCAIHHATKSIKTMSVSNNTSH